METNRKEALAQVLTDVLEQMAFMFTDQVDEDQPPEPAEDGLLAKMGFSGPFAGSMMLAVPAETCPLIAENMLGMDADDERAMEKARDALKEVLNVTCGNALTVIAGEEPVFDLTVPEVTEVDSDAWRQLAAHPDTVALLVDDYPMLLRMVMDSQGADVDSGKGSDA